MSVFSKADYDTIVNFYDFLSLLWLKKVGLFFFSFSEYSPSLVCYFYFDRSNTPNIMQSESKNKLFRSTVKHQHRFQIPIIGI